MVAGFGLLFGLGRLESSGPIVPFMESQIYHISKCFGGGPIGTLEQIFHLRFASLPALLLIHGAYRKSLFNSQMARKATLGILNYTGISVKCSAPRHAPIWYHPLALRTLLKISIVVLSVEAHGFKTLGMSVY